VPLKELFQGLYALVVDRNTSVADYWELTFGNLVWGAPVFVWGRFIDDMLSFLFKLNKANLGDSLLDKVRWDLNTKGCFIVRSLYLKLLHLNCSSSETICDRGFPYKLMWKPLAL